jgi:general nucleoside transport system permease protein
MALLYSFLRVGGPIMQNDANVSFEIVRVIQAIIILLFTAEGLVAFLEWRRAQRVTPLTEQDASQIAESAVVR